MRRRTSPCELRARPKRARHFLRRWRARFVGPHQIPARHLVRRHALLRLGSATRYPNRVRRARGGFLHCAPSTGRADGGRSNRRRSSRDRSGCTFRRRGCAGRARPVDSKNGALPSRRRPGSCDHGGLARLRRSVLGISPSLRVPIRHSALRRRSSGCRRSRVLASADRSGRGTRGVAGTDRTARFRSVLQEARRCHDGARTAALRLGTRGGSIDRVRQRRCVLLVDGAQSGRGDAGRR